MKGFDQCCAVRQHGTLVDGALVGDFAFVERWRVADQVQARHAAGTAGCGLRQLVDDFLEMRDDRGAVQHLPQRRICRHAGKRPHQRRRKHQGTDFLQVDAGKHDVLNIRRAGCDDFGAHRPNADKSAGRQFEVFGNPAIKLQAKVDVGVINPAHGIAGAKKAFFVQSLKGFLRRAPVARRDIGALVADFGLAL